MPSERDQGVWTALWTLVTGDPAGLALFTEDVTGRSPMAMVDGRPHLHAQLCDRRDGLTDVDLTVDGIEEDGETTVVRWRFDAVHGGPILIDEDVLYEPTRRRLRVSVVSRLTYRGSRICAFADEYDLDDILRQLRVDPPTDPDGPG